MCGGVSHAENWRHGDMCIECELSAKNAKDGLPHWVALPSNQCHMCGDNAILDAQHAIEVVREREEKEQEETAAAADGANAAAKDATAKQTLFALLAFGGVNALLVLVVVLLGGALVAVIARSRRSFHALEPDEKAAFVAQATNRGIVRGVAVQGSAPSLPPRPDATAETGVYSLRVVEPGNRPYSQVAIKANPLIKGCECETFAV